MEGGTQSESTISSEDDVIATAGCSPNQEHKRSEMTLLDLYSGCGGMSTGLCLGANISGVNLVTVRSIFTIFIIWLADSKLQLW